MDFSEALKAMKEGKDVTREAWINMQERVYLDDDGQFRCYTKNDVKDWKTNNIHYLPSYDILATDWKIVEASWPKYQSIKVVEALQIKTVKPVHMNYQDFVYIYFVATGIAPFVLAKKDPMLARYMPKDRDYLIKYINPDNSYYYSFSPKDVFEAGYKAIDNN